MISDLPTYLLPNVGSVTFAAAQDPAVDRDRPA
jgi:hypothetical protein